LERLQVGSDGLVLGEDLKTVSIVRGFDVVDSWHDDTTGQPTSLLAHSTSLEVVLVLHAL